MFAGVMRSVRSFSGVVEGSGLAIEGEGMGGLGQLCRAVVSRVEMGAADGS
jgi:hypothetical protein